jgi:hypothetical protein
MKQLIIQIPDNKYPFFMELLHQFDYVSFKSKSETTKGILDVDSEEEILEQIREDVNELKMVLNGERKARPAIELLNEL